MNMQYLPNMQSMLGMTSFFGGGFNPFFSIGNLLGGCGMNSNMFMNCDGSTNYKALTGFAVGSTLFSVIGMAVSSAIQNRQANSQDALSTKVDDIATELKNAKKKLDKENGNLKTLNSSTKEITTAKEEAVKEHSKANKYMEDNKSDYEKAKAKKDKNEPLSETEKIIITNYEEYKTKLPKLKAAEEAAIKKEKEHNEKIEAKNALIKEIEADIKELEEKLETAQKNLDSKILDDADGNACTRISDENYKAKFNDDNSIADGAKFGKRDLRRAICLYSAATSTEDKEKYKAQFNKIYKYLSDNDSDKVVEFKEAHELINKKVS